MTELTAPEADGDLNLVAVLQEADGVVALGFKIVGIDAEAQTNLFDLNRFLILSGFLFPFGLLEAILTVVHYLANGRNGVGRNVDKIEIFCVGRIDRLIDGQDSELRAVRIDDTDFLEFYTLIDG